MTKYIIIASSLLLVIVLSYFRSKRAKNKVVRVIADNCAGCQLCVKKCRHKALEMTDSDNGKCVVLKYPEKCTACRDCILVCKLKAVELVNRK